MWLRVSGNEGFHMHWEFISMNANFCKLSSSQTFLRWMAWREHAINSLKVTE